MGKVVSVDDDDADLLSRIRWRIAPNGYVYATVYLHRMVMKAPLGMEVDHLHRNRQDCQKQNLEVVTHAVNTARRAAHGRLKAKSHTSRYLGVCFYKKTSKWRASFRRKHLGLFKTELEAHRAYQMAADAYFATL